MNSNDNNLNPRPNLPSLLDTPKSTQSDVTGGIRLPPISFLHNVSQLPAPQIGVPRLLNEPPKESTLPSLQTLPQLGASTSPTVSSATKSPTQSKNFPFSAGPAPSVPLKTDLTKPDVDSESDEDIIKYYETKFGITDFTSEEKHDILQHERRARIEKKINPNYKTYLCYSIIKRLNTMKDPKKERKEDVLKQEETQMPPLASFKPVAPGAGTSQLQAMTPSTSAPEDTSAHSPHTTLAQIHNGKPETATENTEDSMTTHAPASAPEEAAGVTIAVSEHQPPTKFVKREVIINNKDVLDYASKFPRKHLGSLLYTPFPTKSSYKELSILKYLQVTEEQDKQIVPLLPELREYINSIVTVRIPSWQITDLQNNKNYQDRSIWGTDVYTDDSDVLLILKHNGFLPLVDPEIEGEEKTMEKRTPGNRNNIANITQSVTNFRQFVNIIGGDIHVDLIILPPLTEYIGVFRNGFNSRSWTGGHDGMSVAVYGVRYGEKGSAVESMNCSDLKKRKIAELEQLKQSPLGTWRLNKEAWKRAKQEMKGANGAGSKDPDATTEADK